MKPAPPLVLLAAIAVAVAVEAIACSSESVVEQSQLLPGSGVAGSSPSFTSPPETRLDCSETIASLCSDGTDRRCILEWSVAETPISWLRVSDDGCARLSTAPCSGFDIADPGATTPAGGNNRYFFDPTSGALVAIVFVTDADDSMCVAGPAGFSDPLILNCNGPTRTVCGTSEAGAPGDEAGVSPSADAAVDSRIDAQSPEDAATDASLAD